VATNLIPESILARYRPSPRHGKEAYFSSKENMITGISVLSLNSKHKNYIFPVLAFYIYIYNVFFSLVSFLPLTDAKSQ
jgi:hypothetical protein